MGNRELKGFRWNKARAGDAQMLVYLVGNDWSLVGGSGHSRQLGGDCRLARWRCDCILTVQSIGKKLIHAHGGVVTYRHSPGQCGLPSARRHGRPTSARHPPPTGRSRRRRIDNDARSAGYIQWQRPSQLPSGGVAHYQNPRSSPPAHSGGGEQASALDGGVLLRFPRESKMTGVTPQSAGWPPMPSSPNHHAVICHDCSRLSSDATPQSERGAFLKPSRSRLSAYHASPCVPESNRRGVAGQSPSF
jgi:hypothetical protein